MKTLYVSDLDGTLLRSNEKTSDFTNETINTLVKKGLLFSYATARSYHTSTKVTRGLEARIPLIVYNGAVVIHNGTGEVLLSNFFGEEGREILADLISRGLYPIVYSFQNGVEKFSYLYEKCTQPTRDFLATRKGDRRDTPVERVSELFAGDLFYFTLIGEEAALRPAYEAHRERCHAVFQKDIYSGEQWLELMPLKASKSQAALQLKKQLGCDRLVVFGDGINDIDLFQAADESYAVENAVQELKAVATDVIGSNDTDGVARWLLAHVSENEVVDAQMVR